jgi:hypothetical protein
MNREERMAKISDYLKESMIMPDGSVVIGPVLAEIIFDIEMIKQQLKLLGDIISGLLPQDMVKELNNDNE